MWVNVRAILEKEINQEKYILLQRRDKPNEPRNLEVPGGRLEEFEQMKEGVTREVKEETGLDITNFIDVKYINQVEAEGKVIEGLQPFAVYQTLEGKVDSFGVVFVCNAEGELLSKGDQTTDIQWVPVSKLQELISNNELTAVAKSIITMYMDSISNGSVK